jgi:hypothetical protein
MNRTDIASLLLRSARPLPPEPRGQFAKFLATLTGAKRLRRRKVHSWHKKPAKRPERQNAQGELQL